VAVVAAVFGLATIVAGGRVLTGWSDPGYVVYRPLLIYNTAMGVAYLAAGSSVAIDSLRAMTFRTAVWLALFEGLVWKIPFHSPF
jgi:hypothetical protein